MLAHVQTGWGVQPVPIAIAAIAIALFTQGFVRLRGRAPEHAPLTRPFLFAAAVACGVLPLVSPLDGIADDYLLSAHMLEHVLIGDVAPALATLAIRGPLVFFLLPQPVLRRLARVGALRSFFGFLLRPLVTFVLWLSVTAFWHVPGVYDYAVEHEHVHDLEHLTFVIAGTLLWAQLVDPARRRELTPAGRILFAWAIFLAGSLTTHIVLLDSVPHYAHYVRQPDRLLGLSPLADQHWAAWLMMVEQVFAFGTLTLVLIGKIPIPAREPAPRESG